MKIIHALWLSTMILATASAQERPTFSLSEENSADDADVTTEANPAAAQPVARRTQWLMFTAAWCQPCASAKLDFEPWLRNSGWIVNETETAHVRLIDGDSQPALVEQYQITQYPTFLLVRDGAVLFRQTGYPGRQALATRYQQAVESSRPVVGAISAGTLKGQRDNIAQLIAALRPLLSGGGTFTLRLDRTRSQTVDLPLGERLSIRLADPLVINFTLKQDELTCRFDEPLPRARLSLGVPIEQAVSAVTVSVSEVVLELPRAPDVRLLVEP